METTLNMRTDIFKQITYAARLRGVSRSGIIISLVKEAMKDISDPGRLGSMVRYQKRMKRCDWQLFHLQVGEDDYEFLLDMRKLCKMSVSLILAYAVEKYLSKLVKNKNADNYRFKNYAIVRECLEGVICWKFFWGLPLNLSTLF
ncbi:MAG TPA: hypothetical protein PLM53_12765 [Spirochaetota bacterium]|nr:hypothetical protein [Spirochaetota bacterium]HPC40673.1 hypothetical protein [Spirochaetota bacterium]HPL18277.1 hypothetical protein [Spirochaetota bacterium]HQF09419.1 hypothetical protein [Spirochaetota bacterium]HQH97967.1 hypothetical protein [Spirochaetota bacterium]